MYESFIRCFYKSYHDFPFTRGWVPYENSYLPTLYLKNKNAKKTLLVIGGFDGYLEEVAGFFKYLKGTNYNIFIFDGPGQGNTSMHGLHFIPNFERPVSAVLDYYGLKSVVAIGLSWGGLLVLQAAAFEKRIKKIICMDIFYTPMDTLAMNLGRVKYGMLRLLLWVRAQKIVNLLFTEIMKNNIDMTWKINNGYLLTGENSPFHLIQNLQRHNAKKFLPLINQDCLLLAGKEDQYVPYKRLRQIQRELINSSYVQFKLFTKETGGEQHCQVGQMNLAFDEIRQFLNEN